MPSTMNATDGEPDSDQTSRATRRWSNRRNSSEELFDRFIHDPDLMSEVDRLLAGRTRHVRLTGELAEGYRQRMWRQTAKVIRSWMVWVIILDVSMMCLNVILLPPDLAAEMVLPSAMIVPAALLVFFVWQSPSYRRLAGLSLLAGMAVILLSVAWMGVVGGEALLERYLTIMLFVAITGIIIFNVPLSQSVAIAVIAMAIYLIFQLGGLQVDTKITLSGFFFYASGVGATVLARRTMNILAQQSFLLELRDRRHMTELARANRRLERLSLIDGLTGAANRHQMDERLEALSLRTAQVAVLMCDIDDFKTLNDRLGHAQGDHSLKEVVRVLKACTRNDDDCVARYGGEEFVVLLADAEETDAVDVALRIREMLARAALPNPGSSFGPTLTISIGIAAGAIGTSNVSASQLLERADQALYAAKRNGRDRVRVWGREVDASTRLTPPH